MVGPLDHRRIPSRSIVQLPLVLGAGYSVIPIMPMAMHLDFSICTLLLQLWRILSGKCHCHEIINQESVVFFRDTLPEVEEYVLMCIDKWRY